MNHLYGNNVRYHKVSAYVIKRLKQAELTDEVAVLHPLNARLRHRFRVHVRLRLANEGRDGVIAERDAVKGIFEAQDLDHAARVRDVRVGEEPQLHLGPVDVAEQATQLGPRLDEVLERERVVDLGVEP